MRSGPAAIKRVNQCVSIMNSVPCTPGFVQAAVGLHLGVVGPRGGRRLLILEFV
jgi:hypothetical protein